MPKITIDEKQFQEDVANGFTVLALAEKYEISAPTVSKFKKRLANPEEADDSEANLYTLTVDVQAEHLDGLLQDAQQDELLQAVLLLCAQDKAAVFQNIMQRRFNPPLLPSRNNDQEK